jgi:hypothetical protein
VSLRVPLGAVPGAGSFTVNYLADCAAVPNMRIIGQIPQKITNPFTDLGRTSPSALLTNPRPPGRRVPPDPPSGPAGAAHWKAPG